MAMLIKSTNGKAGAVYTVNVSNAFQGKKEGYLGVENHDYCHCYSIKLLTRVLHYKIVEKGRQQGLLTKYRESCKC